MRAVPEPLPPVFLAPASSQCDVCNVTRAGDRVLVHFGERLAGASDPRITEAALRHRVGLDEATAARLHELMAELLSSVDQALTAAR